MTKALAARFILRISCRDKVGIVADVATFLAGRQLFIIETANFGDPHTGLFFMRTVFTPQAQFTTTEFRNAFEASLAQALQPGAVAAPLAAAAAAYLALLPADSAWRPMVESVPALPAAGRYLVF